MKTLKLIVLAAFALLFSQCKSPTQVMQAGQPSLLQVYQVLDTAEKQFFQFADSTHGNPQQALMLTANWVKSQPNVQSAESLDSTYINITMKSGLTTTFSFDQVDSDGISLSRGGGGDPTASESHLIAEGTSATNTITNKSVLIWGPAYLEFYRSGEMLKITNMLNQSSLGLKLDLLLTSDCTYQSVLNFPNYGFVDIAAHGIPDGILTGTSLKIMPVPSTEAGLVRFIDSSAGAGTYTKMLSGDLKIDWMEPINTLLPIWQKKPSTAKVRILVGSRYLNGLSNMNGTVVFANSCYSGATTAPSGSTTVKNAFLSKNVISYYGYAHADGSSSEVSNEFSKQMEDSLVHALVIATDSTGIANLKANGAEFYDAIGILRGYSKLPLYLKLFGANNYSYANCGDPFTDARDGQTYKTVCIGSQTWMAQNLNYAAPGSSCYGDDASNCSTYGHLYTSSTMMQGAAASTANPSGVQGVCPKGWHVPSAPEWTQLINFLGGPTVAGGALKKDTILWQVSLGKPGTNSSGFSALPAGAGNLTASFSWNGIGTEAWFGSTSFYPGITNPDASVISWNDVSFTTTVATPGMKTSCRCVKDP